MAQGSDSQGPSAGRRQTLPSEVRRWMLSFPSQNSVSWLPKPRLYESQSRKKFTDPSQRLWKTCRKGEPQPRQLPPESICSARVAQPPEARSPCGTRGSLGTKPQGNPSLTDLLHLPLEIRRKLFGSGYVVLSLLAETSPGRIPCTHRDSSTLTDVNLSCPLRVCFPPFLFLFWCNPLQP